MEVDEIDRVTADAQTGDGAAGQLVTERVLVRMCDDHGGVLYYELAPNRPDLVLQDIVKILHPTLLPEHDMYFFSKL